MYAKERRSRMTLEDALLDNNRLLSKAYVERANRYMDPVGPVDEYTPLTGLPWLMAAHQVDESDPGRREASRLRLGTALKLVPSVEKIWFHPGKVSMAAASSDGAWLFTAGDDGTGRLWKYSDDKAERRPLMHPAAVTAAAFSPDNKLLLTGCADGSARLWDTASDRLVAGPLFAANSQQPKPAWSRVSAVCFSRDGRLFATCSVQATQIWETGQQRLVGPPITLRRPSTSMEFANRDAFLALACTDGSIVLWDIQAGKEKHRLQAPRRAPAIAAVSPDGTTLAGTASPETVAMWDCGSGKKLERPPIVHDSKVVDVRFSRDGHFLAAGTMDGTLFLWNAHDGRLVWKRRVSANYIRGINFANHGPELVVATRVGLKDRRLTVLDTESGDLIAEPIALPGVLRSENWVGQADLLATSSVDGTVRLWRTESDEAAVALPHSSDIGCAALTDDRRLLATVDDEGICCLVRLPSDQAPSPEMARFPTNITQPLAAALTADRKLLAVSDRKSNVLIFDLATRRILRRMESSAPVLKMAFTPESRHLITVSRKGHLTAWKADGGDRTQHQQLDVSGDVHTAALRGTLCAVVVGKQIFVRDALNLSWAGVLLPHDQLIAACCMSPDGGLILSACDDGIARVWERATGKLLAATPKVSQSIVSVAFSPNATRFVTATEDGTVRIWWTANARPATGTFSHGSTVTGLAFSPDGRYLISTSGDSTWFNLRGGEPFFRVWDASNGDSICCRMVKRLSGRFPMSDRGF